MRLPIRTAIWSIYLILYRYGKSSTGLCPADRQSLLRLPLNSISIHQTPYQYIHQLLFLLFTQIFAFWPSLFLSFICNWYLLTKLLIASHLLLGLKAKYLLGQFLLLWTNCSEVKALWSWDALPEKCPYLELFWSAFSLIWTEFEKNNSEYGHFLRSYDFNGALVISWEDKVKIVRV